MRVFYVDKLKIFFRFAVQFKYCSSGGIGRRAGFKIQFFRECGFDSHLEYKKPCKSLIYKVFTFLLFYHLKTRAKTPQTKLCH